jgi:ribosomal protein S18 acetylase RimI-like enzyme
VIDTLAHLSTRPVTAADEPELRAIYQSIRATELAAVGWPAGAIETFCNQQYDMQQAHYSQVYAGADHRAVVDHDGSVVGQLMVHVGATTHTIVDIGLLPEHRGNGCGTRLLTQVIESADQLGVAVELTVDCHNPAEALYRRLGFEPISSTELHLHMRRPATGKEPE